MNIIAIRLVFINITKYYLQLSLASHKYMYTGHRKMSHVYGEAFPPSNSNPCTIPTIQGTIELTLAAISLSCNCVLTIFNNALSETYILFVTTYLHMHTVKHLHAHNYVASCL